MRRRKTCLRMAFLCLKRLTNGLKYAILLGYRILGCRQAVRQRTLTPSPRGFESRQPSQKKRLCVLQSPFFNKINPLGICETALWTIKCLRMFIKRKTVGLRNHLAQQLRVFQHGARAQVFSLNGWPSWYAMKSGDYRTSSSAFSRMLESE